jgi:hypothetical protein
VTGGYVVPMPGCLNSTYLARDESIIVDQACQQPEVQVQCQCYIHDVLRRLSIPNSFQVFFIISNRE